MSAQFTLSVFGDEISDELSVQLTTLADLNIRFLELRGVWGKNVLELSDKEVCRLQSECSRSSIQVSAIGSPIGKSPLYAPPELELNNLQRAFEIAEILHVHYVRIFSFYPPEGVSDVDNERYVADAIARLSSLAAEAEKAGLTLLLENEKGIVGDTIVLCHRLLTGANTQSLQFAWDPANFVQVGEKAPTADGWALLGDYTSHVHIKDALANGEVRPAGKGDGQVGLLLDNLRDHAYRGFLALEPHLEIAGHSSGFSGADGMARAAAALRDLMVEHGCEEVRAQ